MIDDWTIYDWTIDITSEMLIEAGSVSLGVKGVIGVKADTLVYKGEAI